MPYHFTSAGLLGSTVQQVYMSEASIVNSTLDMNMRNITSVSDPVRPQDAATKNFVETQLQKVSAEIENQFSPFVVSLVGSDWVQVATLRPGSFVVTISGTQDGAPTATYSMSKSSITSFPQVMRVTSVPSRVTREQLELKWDQQGRLLLRKTGSGYDGDYICNPHSKKTQVTMKRSETTFQTTINTMEGSEGTLPVVNSPSVSLTVPARTAPVVPTGVLKQYFSLDGDREKIVMTLPKGMYVCYMFSKDPGEFRGIFALSKDVEGAQGGVFPMQVHGDITVSLQWKPDGTLVVSKTGETLMDFMLQVT